MLWLIFLMPFYSDIFFSYVKKKEEEKKSNVIYANLGPFLDAYRTAAAP